MPARTNHSRRSSRSGGRVTPKGTRPTSSTHDTPGPRPPVDRSRFRGGDTRVRPTGYRPPAPRSGTRGNR